jgi:hypothetical protein
MGSFWNRLKVLSNVETLSHNEGRGLWRNNIQMNFRRKGIVDGKLLEQAEGPVQC